MCVCVCVCVYVCVRARARHKSCGGTHHFAFEIRKFYDRAIRTSFRDTQRTSFQFCGTVRVWVRVRVRVRVWVGIRVKVSSVMS